MATVIINGWGRRIPDDMLAKIAVTWGARAIYIHQQIDLLPDRQSWYLDGFSEDDADETSVEYENRRARMRPLIHWLDKKGLPFLRKEAKHLSTDDSRVVTPHRTSCLAVRRNWHAFRGYKRWLSGVRLHAPPPRTGLHCGHALRNHCRSPLRGVHLPAQPVPGTA
jgi:hypothetical protein